MNIIITVNQELIAESALELIFYIFPVAGTANSEDFYCHI